MEEYIVQPNDNLFSISLKTNVRLYTLQQLNGLSEESILIPGMRVKLKEIDRATNFLLKNPQNYSAEVNYCTDEGEIPGKLEISPELLQFFPSDRGAESCKYNLICDLGDIFEVNVLDNCDVKPREHIIFIQIVATTLGYEGVCDICSVPKANIYFKVLF